MGEMVYVLTSLVEKKEWRPVAVVDGNSLDVANQWVAVSKNNDWIPLEMNDMSLTGLGDMPGGTNFKPLPTPTVDESMQSLQAANARLVRIVQQLAEKYDDKAVLKALQQLPKPKTGAGKVDIDWKKNMYGKFKLTVEHSWHEQGDEIDTDEDVNESNWNLLIVNAFDTTKEQSGQPGKWVGSAEFVLRHGDLESCNTEVDKEYHRQGIATAMYQFAEGFTGHATSPHNEQSPAGRALWQQRGRPFGGRRSSLLRKHDQSNT
jgi:hypothetical protein